MYYRFVFLYVIYQYPSNLRPFSDEKSKPGKAILGGLSSPFTTVLVPKIPISPPSLDTLPLNPSVLSSWAQYDLQLSKQYPVSYWGREMRFRWGFHFQNTSKFCTIKYKLHHMASLPLEQ